VVEHETYEFTVTGLLEHLASIVMAAACTHGRLAYHMYKVAINSSVSALPGPLSKEVNPICAFHTMGLFNFNVAFLFPMLDLCVPFCI